MAYLAGRWPLDGSRPTLVFLHGAGQRGLFWQAQIEGLTPWANTIALDLPGHGASGGSGLTSIEAYAHRVAAFLAHVEAPRPIPCGISMGGAIALHLLIHHGEGLEAAILVNTGARLKVIPGIIETIERDYAAHLKGVVDFAVAAANRTDAAILRRVKASFVDTPSVAADDFRACNAFDLSERVGEIRAPVLAMSADQDILTPVKYAAWLVDRITGARHVTIDNAGHLSPVEQPAAVNRAMADFIESLDG